MLHRRLEQGLKEAAVNKCFSRLFPTPPTRQISLVCKVRTTAVTMLLALPLLALLAPLAAACVSSLTVIVNFFLWKLMLLISFQA